MVISILGEKKYSWARGIESAKRVVKRKKQVSILSTVVRVVDPTEKEPAS